MPNYQRLSPKIEKVTINNPATDNLLEWINVTDAGKKEIEYLRKQYGFDIQHLRASTANVFSYRPMLLDKEDYLFLILHFPVSQDNRIIAGEVEFFIGHGYLITLHNNNLPALNDFFSLTKKAPESLDAYHADSSAILLSEILDRLIKSCYPLIDSNLEAIGAAEEAIFDYQQKKAVSMILNLRHNIINVRRILQNHKNILKKLVDMKSSLVPAKEIRLHYERLVENSKSIWEMLDNQKEMVEVLNSTNESLLNDRMTNIMKTLTIISVIVFPLTLMAAIFGMNAKFMPLVDHPYGFWYILALMTFLSLLMLLYFEKKKWLQ